MMTSRGGVGPLGRAAVLAAGSLAVADDESVAPQAAPDAIVASAETAMMRPSARCRAVEKR